MELLFALELLFIIRPGAPDHGAAGAPLLVLLIIRLLFIIRPRAAGAPEAMTVRRMALVLKIVQCVWPLTAQARAENRAVCLSWSNAPYQRCSSMRDGL